MRIQLFSKVQRKAISDECRQDMANVKGIEKIGKIKAPEKTSQVKINAENRAAGEKEMDS